MARKHVQRQERFFWNLYIDCQKGRVLVCSGIQVLAACHKTLAQQINCLSLYILQRAELFLLANLQQQAISLLC